MPFIPTQNNASTVSSNLERGWRERQNKATNKRAADADWREVDRIRQQHFAELERKGREEAEQRHAKHTAKVSCPCCDTGTISVELAEKVIRALAVLPAASQPDQDVLAKLLTIAAGRPVTDPLSLHPTLNLHAPRRAVAQTAPVMMAQDEAGDDASALAAYVREESAREAEIAAMQAADDAETLAAVQAATPVPAPAPEPVEPRKHRGRRSAPLPFLTDDA